MDKPLDVKAIVARARGWVEVLADDIPADAVQRLEEVRCNEEDTMWRVCLSYPDARGVRQYRVVRLGVLWGDVRGFTSYDPLAREKV